MKPLCLLYSLLGLPFLAAAQTTAIDTTSGRYYQPIFANVTVTSDLTYGSATTYANQTQVLKLDLYQPTGDAAPQRPLIVFAHGGGFIAGTKTDAYPVAFCTRLARLGYVVASIEYRLGFAATGIGAAADTAQIALAAIRGGQDMKAAVRFFRQSAAGANAYRLYPSYIIAAGSSAGAFMALETGYLDKASEVPASIDLAALGGVEGTGGNPGYSSAVAAVVSLSGATQSPDIIEAGDVPLCSAHGTADPLVPYAQGKIGFPLPPKYVFGSAKLNARTTALGITNVLLTFKGAGHVPFETSQPYADTTFRTVRDFLRPLLRRAGVALATRAGTAPAAFQAYPVPAREVVQLALPADFARLGEAEVLDAAGRVVRRFRPQTQQEQLLRNGLPAGLYAVRFAGQVPVRVVFE